MYNYSILVRIQIYRGVLIVKRIADVLYNCFCKVEIICISLICIALLYGIDLIVLRSHEILLVGFYLLFCSICIFITYLMRNILKKAKIRTRVIFVMIIAFIIRVIACYFLNLTQKGDYGVYLSVAEKIASGNFTQNIYYGIFPHALNYPIFISGLYKFIGNFTWIPRLVNLILEVIEVGCVVGIAEKSVNPRFGLMAGLAVALNPSIILFTLFAGGEPLYDMLIMAALLCFVNIYRKSKKIGVVFAVFAGIISALGNFFRPTGVVFIIASVIIFFVFDKNGLKVKLIRTVALVVSYATFVFILGQLTCSISGYKKPSPSYGWNLFIGANKESGGHWNASDSALFNIKEKENNNPSEVQSYFAKLGFKRYYEMSTGIPRHFVCKLSVWFDESFIANSVARWQNEHTRFKSADISQTYNLICFFYNLLVVIGAMGAMLFMGFSKKSPPGLKLASLYMLGSIIIFMILETAARYKGAYYSIITLLGAYGIFTIYHKLKNAYFNRIFLGNT